MHGRCTLNTFKPLTHGPNIQKVFSSGRLSATYIPPTPPARGDIIGGVLVVLAGLSAWQQSSSGDVLHRGALQHEAFAAGFLGGHEYLPLPRRSTPPRTVLSACPRRPVGGEDAHGHLCPDFLHLLQEPRGGDPLVPFFVFVWVTKGTRNISWGGRTRH